MGSGTLLEYAMRTLRLACFGRFQTQHVMVCHGCDAKDACRIESAQHIIEQ
jgi:hypothetical protein